MYSSIQKVEKYLRTYLHRIIYIHANNNNIIKFIRNHNSCTKFLQPREKICQKSTSLSMQNCELHQRQVPFPTVGNTDTFLVKKIFTKTLFSV